MYSKGNAITNMFQGFIGGFAGFYIGISLSLNLKNLKGVDLIVFVVNVVLLTLLCAYLGVSSILLKRKGSNTLAKHELCVTSLTFGILFLTESIIMITMGRNADYYINLYFTIPIIASAIIFTIFCFCNIQKGKKVLAIISYSTITLFGGVLFIFACLLGITGIVYILLYSTLTAVGVMGIIASVKDSYEIFNYFNFKIKYKKPAASKPVMSYYTPNQSSSKDNSIVDKIRDLQTLKEQNLITEEEYQAKKEELMSKL